MTLAILVLAAGASSRMGTADKLLEDVDGQPCIAHVVHRAEKACADVLVTLPDLSHPRVAALEGTAAQLVAVPDAIEGMGASIRAGVAALGADVSAVMILPADMPDITAQDMTKLWAIFQASKAQVVQATTQSHDAGHPVIFSRAQFAALAKLTGDTGARAIIANAGRQLVRVPLEGTRARTDLDSPEDWAKWRAARAP